MARRPASREEAEFNTSIVEAGAAVPVRRDVMVSEETPTHLAVMVARGRDGLTTVEVMML